MSVRDSRSKGSALLEFTFVGIPMVFILISVFEMARGMWVYHTLAHAIKEGTRYAIVHGYNCDIEPNTCKDFGRVADVANRIRESGVGLLPEELNVELWYGDPINPLSNPVLAYNCDPIDKCLSNVNRWPAYPANQPGMEITVRGTYPFRSAIAMLWPGAGRGINFPAFLFPATSKETIQF